MALVSADLLLCEGFAGGRISGLWLGRGRTVAQLHHDANENIVVVLRGSKHFRLFPPSAGDALHEGYMLEVQQRLRRLWFD